MNPSRRIGNPAARLLLTLAAILAVAFCPAAWADNATVSATLVDPSVDAGQPAEYHIDVINGRLERPPLPPHVDGLTITAAGQNQSQQINLGFGTGMQRTVTTTYLYNIETSRPGRFVIPGQQIEVDGTTLRTLPVTLEVMGTGAAGGGSPGQSISAELIIPKTSVYVGESFPVELRTSFGQGVSLRQADSDPILDGEGFSAQKFTRPRGDMREVDGNPVVVINYKTAVTGVKTGTLMVGPVTTMPVVIQPRGRQQRRRNDPFSNPFFDDPFGQFSAPPKQIKLPSNTVNIEVKPLPPGKPANFSGGIGDFKLEAEADPRKAQAGDPVTVRLMLSGRGNFDRIAAPVLSDERGLRTYPATSKFKADDEVNLSGVKTFEQVVIADGARTSLPAYHFSYLDPATGKYATLDTPPVPVEIVGGNTPAPAASVASAPAATPAATPTPSRPPKPAEDILYIRTDSGPARTAADFLPPYRRRLGSAFLAGAVGGVGGVSRGAGGRRNRGPRPQRKSPAIDAGAPRAGGTPARVAAGEHRPGAVLFGGDATGAAAGRHRRRTTRRQPFRRGHLPDERSRRPGRRVGGGDFSPARRAGLQRRTRRAGTRPGGRAPWGARHVGNPSKSLT